MLYQSNPTHINRDNLVWEWLLDWNANDTSWNGNDWTATNVTYLPAEKGYVWEVAEFNWSTSRIQNPSINTAWTFWLTFVMNTAVFPTVWNNMVPISTYDDVPNAWGYYVQLMNTWWVQSIRAVFRSLAGAITIEYNHSMVTWKDYLIAISLDWGTFVISIDNVVVTSLATLAVAENNTKLLNIWNFG